MAATTLPTLLNHPILIAMMGAVLGLLFGVLLMQLAKVKLSDRYQRQQLADATELQQRQEQLERLQTELAMVKGNNQHLDQDLQQHRARIRELELDQVRLQQGEAQNLYQDNELAEHVFG